VLHELGAPDSVLVAGKPHLGTDRLVRILRAFRHRLQSLGVDIRFGTRADRLLTRGDRCCGVQLCGAALLWPYSQHQPTNVCKVNNLSKPAAPWLMSRCVAVSRWRADRSVPSCRGAGSQQQSTADAARGRRSQAGSEAFRTRYVTLTLLLAAQHEAPCTRHWQSKAAVVLVSSCKPLAFSHRRVSCGAPAELH